MRWLLRTEALADVALILPDDSPEVKEQEQEQEQDDDGALVEGSDSRLGGKARRRFLAHSTVLAARSEKFAAMLRFVRMQDSQLSHESSSSTSERSLSADDGDDDDNQDEEPAECGEKSAGANMQPPATLLSAVPGDPTLRCRGRRTRRNLPGRRRRRRQARPRAVRELELRSPLLSARSLRFFLEFLYTGILDPALSTAELSEAALIADEYLVPELTHQAEMLLVEALVRTNATRQIDARELFFLSSCWWFCFTTQQEVCCTFACTPS